MVPGRHAAHLKIIVVSPETLNPPALDGAGAEGSGGLVRVGLQPVSEPMPASRAEGQHGAGTVLGVPDEHAAAGPCHLNAVPALAT